MISPDEFEKALREALDLQAKDDRSPEERLIDQLAAVVAQHIGWLDRESFESACVRVIDAYWDKAGVNA